MGIKELLLVRAIVIGFCKDFSLLYFYVKGTNEIAERNLREYLRKMSYRLRGFYKETGCLRRDAVVGR